MFFTLSDFETAVRTILTERGRSCFEASSPLLCVCQCVCLSGMNI